MGLKLTASPSSEGRSSQPLRLHPGDPAAPPSSHCLGPPFGPPLPGKEAQQGGGTGEDVPAGSRSGQGPAGLTDKAALQAQRQAVVSKGGLEPTPGRQETKNERSGSLRYHPAGETGDPQATSCAPSTLPATLCTRSHRCSRPPLGRLLFPFWRRENGGPER